MISPCQNFSLEASAGQSSAGFKCWLIDRASWLWFASLHASVQRGCLLALAMTKPGFSVYSPVATATGASAYGPVKRGPEERFHFVSPVRPRDVTGSLGTFISTKRRPGPIKTESRQEQRLEIGHDQRLMALPSLNTARASS